MGAACGKMLKSKDKCSSESEAKSNDHGKNIMEESSNNKSCEVSLMMILPEHLIIDIISRVSLKWLLNSVRYVCKPWATIIGSSDFAEAHCTHSKPGLYVENLNSKRSAYFLDIKDDLNGHFERIDLETPPGMERLLSTCDGILLFWDYSDLFVVNPILKCCLRLPPLPTPPKGQQALRNYVIAHVPRSVTFKLFFVNVIMVPGGILFVFYVLNIGIDNSWREIARKKVGNEFQSFATHFNFLESVYSGGNDLYWITKNGVTKMDVDKEVAVAEYPLPPLLAGIEGLDLIGQFLWMENYLSWIVNVHFNKTFQIYILDIDSGKWTLYHEIGPFDFVAACGHEFDVKDRCTVLWMNGKLIIQIPFYESERSILFGYNIKTRRLTKIEGIPEGYFQVWLHTNSLASLPRL